MNAADGVRGKDAVGRGMFRVTEKSRRLLRVHGKSMNKARGERPLKDGRVPDAHG